MSTSNNKFSKLELLNTLSEISLKASNYEEAMFKMAGLGREILDAHTVFLGFIGIDQQNWTEIAFNSLDKELGQQLNENSPKFEDWSASLEKNEKFQSLLAGDQIEDLNPHRSNWSVLQANIWEAKDLNSLLCSPLVLEDKVIGFICQISHKKSPFSKDEKHLLSLLAKHCVFVISGLSEKIAQYRREELSKLMIKLMATESIEELWDCLILGIKEISNIEHIAINRVNYKDGTLEIIRQTKEREIPGQKPNECKGITFEAFQKGKIINAGDVLAPQYKQLYYPYWKNIRSELAIPISLDNTQIRIGQEITNGVKVIGVLNLESPQIKVFSEVDEKNFSLLARITAIQVDRIESDKKLNDLREIEKQIIKERDYETVMNYVLKSIANVLSFDFVNISLINNERTHIKSEYVWGLNDEDTEKFKSKVIHSLESDDIQADIVRTKNIEVPNDNDKRFNSDIFNSFNHQLLKRVFLPMIDSSNDQVIGTVEAGYQKLFRKHIYERDIQILESFVSHAAHALERKRSGLIDRITHEFKAPIIGIRSNASFIQKRFDKLNPAFIDIKLTDILTDSEILLHQIVELEYLLGGSRIKQIQKTKVSVFKEVVIKTINQLTPIIQERNFSPDNIRYHPEDINKVYIETDKAKINQVIYNLLINSVKYAERDPTLFKIWVEVDEYDSTCLIKFKDWGIGIKNGEEERIFEEGFRSNEAKQSNVLGSGLGLAIAQIISRQLGGDLVLSNNRKPTEFHLILPK